MSEKYSTRYICTTPCLSFNFSLRIMLIVCLCYWKEAVLEVCSLYVSFDQWYSQDIGQGVGMSDPRFSLTS